MKATMDAMKATMEAFLLTKPAIKNATTQPRKLYAKMPGLATDIISICGENVKRVANCEMVDDFTMEAMFCQILSREGEDVQGRIQVFSTYLYSSMRQNTSTHDKVIRFTHPKHNNSDGKRNIDIFAKEMVCIPIFYASHFSLVVLVNHALLLEQEETEKNDTPKAMMIHLDSLPGCHSTAQISSNIHAWINILYKKKLNSQHKFLSPPKIIDSTTLPVVKPDVHYQSNGIDCGMHVLFFFQLLLLRRPIEPTLSDIHNGMKRFFVSNQFTDKDMISMRQYILLRMEKHAETTFELIEGSNEENDDDDDDDDDDDVVVIMNMNTTNGRDNNNHDDDDDVVVIMNIDDRENSHGLFIRHINNKRTKIGNVIVID